MGDSNAPDEFVGTYTPVLEQWHQGDNELSGTALLSVIPTQEEPVDVSLTSFVDDSAKKRPFNQIDGLVKQSEVAEESFAEVVENRGYKQNLDKQVHVPTVAGAGALPAPWLYRRRAV